MLRLGDALLTEGDISVLKDLTRACYGRQGRKIRGIEVGPWLGRSTLTLLAPDLAMTVSNPVEVLYYKLERTEFDSFEKLYESMALSLSAVLADREPEQICLWLSNLMSYLIEPKKPYFSKLWSVDSWEGIVSEKHLYFREAQDDNPRKVFEENIRKAGFADVVEAVPGISWEKCAELTEKVDFVFLDADHEYDSVTKDIFAVRDNLREDTVLCGHDIAQTSRWPGVELAVKKYIKHYEVRGNIWIAEEAGIEFLKSLPPYDTFAKDVEEIQSEHNKRYSDPEYCRQCDIKPDTVGN